MNREQWLKKRNQIETHGMAPAFGAPNFAGHTLESVSLVSGRDFAAIQQQHFGDELDCEEWAMVSHLPVPLHGGSH